jgi:group I intron endonuclease
MIVSGIYAIVNNATNNMYIGSAVNLDRRLRVHKHYLTHDKHPSKHLQNSFNKHTASNFTFEIVEFVDDKAKLIPREQIWIDFFKPAYNKRKLADSCLGVKRSEQARANMAFAQTGKKQSPETIAKRSAALKGRPRPMHVRAKISASHFGIKPSEAARLKMSLAKKGKKKKDIA